VSLCGNVGAPDAVMVGVLAKMIGVPLTECDLFHSHLELQTLIPTPDIQNQISYGTSGSSFLKPPRMAQDGRMDSFANVPPIFVNREDDPLLFRSLHCFLFPSTAECPSERLGPRK